MKYPNTIYLEEFCEGIPHQMAKWESMQCQPVVTDKPVGTSRASTAKIQDIMKCNECNLLAEQLRQAAHPDGPPIIGELPPALQVIEALEQGHNNTELQNIFNRNAIVDATTAMTRDCQLQTGPPVI